MRKLGKSGQFWPKSHFLLSFPPAFIMDPVANWNLICASDSFSCYSFNCLSCQGLLQSPSNADMDYGHVSEAV